MRILVTGITGQAGYYLARRVLEAGHQVTGTTRDLEAPQVQDTRAALPGAHIVRLDVSDAAWVARIVEETRPDRIYHFASEIVVPRVWREPIAATETNALGTLAVLEAARLHAPEARVYVAGSSEAFGRPADPAIAFREGAAMRPATLYGLTKLFAHQAARLYREQYGLHVVSGLAFNHESPWGDRQSVVQHVARSIILIAEDRHPPVLEIGNIEVERDWGYTAEYVEAMELLLEAETPEDDIIATGQSRRVLDVVEAAAQAAGIAMPELHVTADRARPDEVDRVAADPSRIAERLGWRARTKVEALMGLLVRDPEFRARTLASAT